MPKDRVILFKELNNYFNWGFKLKVKQDSVVQRLIAFFLALFGSKGYMKSYYSIIGKTLWVPSKSNKLEILSPSGVPDFLITVLCHEATHLKQKVKEGKLKWYFKYLFSRRRRAEYEVDAYKTSLSVYHALGINDISLYAYARSIPQFLERDYLISSSLAFEAGVELANYCASIIESESPSYRQEDLEYIDFLA